MLLTDKFADKPYGTINCYDRMLIQGYILGWSYAKGMTSYLKSNNIRIFDLLISLSHSPNRFDRMRSRLQMKMVLKLNLSVNFGTSAKMTVFRKSSGVRESRRTGSYFFCYGTK